MNSTHWHLLINHIPVLAVPFGFVVLLWGMLRRSSEVQKLSFAVFIVAAAIGWPTHETGHDASMELQDSSDATSGFVMLHDAAAGYALWAVGALAFFAIIAWIAGRGSRAVPAWASVIVLLLSLFASAVLARTAYLGGQVRHTEIRTKASEAEAIKKSKED
ncbi:MAG TPA: hypothetical protein VGH65_01890 [Verrucomicrobiaceae bacterium]